MRGFKVRQLMRKLKISKTNHLGCRVHKKAGTSWLSLRLRRLSSKNKKDHHFRLKNKKQTMSKKSNTITAEQRRKSLNSKLMRAAKKPAKAR